MDLVFIAEHEHAGVQLNSVDKKFKICLILVDVGRT